MNEKEKLTEMVKKQKQKAEKVKQMIFSDGFKIIQEEMMADSKSLTTKLIESNDKEGDEQTKADVRAIKRFFDKIYYHASIKTD